MSKFIRSTIGYQFHYLNYTLRKVSHTFFTFLTFLFYSQAIPSTPSDCSQWGHEWSPWFCSHTPYFQHQTYLNIWYNVPLSPLEQYLSLLHSGTLYPLVYCFWYLLLPPSPQYHTHLQEFLRTLSWPFFYCLWSPALPFWLPSRCWGLTKLCL